MNRRDLELLSSYLDGQLKPSDSARLESRLSSDPDLRSVLDDLREARSVLRRLPSRKAPRNFTLTRKMVEKNPPMPSSYPIFRFATALATLLLFITFGLNFMAPQLASQAPIYGMGGGGADTQTFAAEAPATEAPAAEPPSELVPLPTQTPAVENSARSAETPSEKSGLTPEPGAPDQFQAPNESLFVPSVWQIVLAGIIVVGALLMVIMRQSALRRWRQ